MFRGVPDAAAGLPDRLRAPRDPPAGRPDVGVLARRHRPDPVLRRLRRRGDPRRHRVRAPEPARRRPVARPEPGPDDADRRAPAGAPHGSRRRCSTTSSRCRRTPRWSPRSGWSPPRRCGRPTSTPRSTSTTRRSSSPPCSSSRLTDPARPADRLPRQPADRASALSGCGMTAVRLENVYKQYGDHVVLQRRRPRRRAARGRRADRVVGLGKVDPAALRQPARAGRRRPDLARRRRHHRVDVNRTRSGAGSAWCSSRSTCSRT